MVQILGAFFDLLKRNAKKATKLAFINADWPARHRSRPNEAISHAQGFRSGEAGGRYFQNKPAAEESHEGSILIDDYLGILNKTGWRHTHIIQAPMSAQRFSAVVVSAMQKKRILGVTSRYVIILKQQDG